MYTLNENINKVALKNGTVINLNKVSLLLTEILYNEKGIEITLLDVSTEDETFKVLLRPDKPIGLYNTYRDDVANKNIAVLEAMSKYAEDNNILIYIRENLDVDYNMTELLNIDSLIPMYSPYKDILFDFGMIIADKIFKYIKWESPLKEKDINKVKHMLRYHIIKYLYNNSNSLYNGKTLMFNISKDLSDNPFSFNLLSNYNITNILNSYKLNLDSHDLITVINDRINKKLKININESSHDSNAISLVKEVDVSNL